MKKRYLLFAFSLLAVGNHAFAQSGNVGIGTSVPGSRLTVNGSFAGAYNTVTANTYTIDANDYYVVWNGTAAGTFTMPAGSVASKGRIYFIKNTTGTRTLTIVPNAAETIDGNASLSLNPGEVAQIVSQGTTTGSTFEVASFGTGTTTGGTTLAKPWTTTGNAGTGATVNFIGTTDAVDFVTKTSGSERIRVLSTGNVGIGVPGPTALLDVNGTARIRTLSAGAITDKVVTTDASGNLRQLATPLFNEVLKGQLVLPPFTGVSDFTGHSNTSFDNSDFIVISKASTSSAANTPSSMVCVYEYNGTPLTITTGVYTFISVFNNSAFPDSFVGNSQGVTNVSSKTRITIKWVRVDQLSNNWSGTFGGSVMIVR